MSPCSQYIFVSTLQKLVNFQTNSKQKANQQLVKLPHPTTICAHLFSVTSFEATQELKTM